jgi:Asp-tRNA(Asn)/Glu-tRNA(Gln) amidotransferase A subunit family amidase
MYEPFFRLNPANTSYLGTSNTVKTPLANPLPFGISFWAGPGDEGIMIKAASAYELATKHRYPPPAFGPLPGEP